jgi:hypothetical protein
MLDNYLILPFFLALRFFKELCTLEINVIWLPILLLVQPQQQRLGPRQVEVG